MLTTVKDEVRIQPVLLNSAYAANVLTSDNTNNADGDTVTVGGIVYTFKTALTGAFATGSITDGNTVNVSEDDTITINGVKYTFRATPRNANDIQIGASADATLASLVNAINGTGTVGTDYFTGTQSVPAITAGVVGTNATTLTANTKGVAGNAITITTTAATLTPSGAHLTGGVNPIANEVLIGSSADDSLTNLEYAINGTVSHIGVKYSIGTVANPVVACGDVASHTVTVTAFNPGHALNTSATTVSASHLSWATTTLMGGMGGILTAATLGNAAGTFYSESFEIGKFAELIAFLNVISHAGTNPTLDVSFQYSPDNVNWMDSADAFAQVTTSNGMIDKRGTANFGRWMRIKVIVGGTTPVYKLDLSVMGKS